MTGVHPKVDDLLARIGLFRRARLRLGALDHPPLKAPQSREGGAGRGIEREVHQHARGRDAPREGVPERHDGGHNKDRRTDPPRRRREEPAGRAKGQRHSLRRADREDPREGERRHDPEHRALKLKVLPRFARCGRSIAGVEREPHGHQQAEDPCQPPRRARLEGTAHNAHPEARSEHKHRDCVEALDQRDFWNSASVHGVCRAPSLPGASGGASDAVLRNW